MIEKVIFDTSVWINFTIGRISPQTNLLTQYLEIDENLVYICPTIIQEYLMGLKTEFDFNFYKKQFERLNLIENDWHKYSLIAAKLYFDLRKKGITIRKSTDCLIAQVAIQSDCLLVHNDSDFELIAQNSTLRTFK